MRKAGTFFKTYFRKHSTTVARVACPQKFFFPTGADKMFFPGFLCMRPILCVRTDKILFFCCHLSRAYSPGHTPQVDNRTCREHDVTTLPPISISRQHRACVTRPSAPYCCGCSGCVHRSLRSVVHPLYLCLCCCCVRQIHA